MFENCKKTLIISSIIFLLFLVIGSISASEDISQMPSESAGIDTKISAVDNDDTQKNVEIGNNRASTVDKSEDSLRNSDDETLKGTSDNDIKTSTETNSISNNEMSNNVKANTENGSSDKDISDDNIHKGVIVSTKADYSSMTQQYTKGKISYQVKLYNIVNYDGIEYREPKYNSIVKLRVYTGSSYKNYYGTINNQGIASILISNLAIGTHSVAIYDGDTKIGSSSIKITKSSTTVYAPTKTVKFRKSNNYKIKVVDSHGNLVNSVALKVKVYTGKKSKTYTIKTNSKGVASYQTKSLAKGTHKVVITSKNKNYKISKTTKIIIKKSVPKTVEKLTAYAPTSTVVYKQSNYFKITVKNNYANTVKNVALKVKVYTGKKSKTYTIKTNSKGVASYQTKSLAKGTHKVVITSKNKNYKISKTSKIIVKTSIAPNQIEAPKLKSLQYYPNGNDYSAKLTWLSKQGSSYQVIRKDNGNYEVISTVKADSESTSFYDKVGKGTLYTYSVRELLRVNNENLIGPYDNEGLKLIDSPNVNVDFQNLKAVINWQGMNGATNYRIFRKINRDAEFKCIAVVGANQLSYTDDYYKSASELSGVLNSEIFADPSFNSLFYTVRACNVKKVDSTQKISYGLYLKDGDFNLEAPTVVSLKDNKITWGTVPNAEGYLILKKSDLNGNWQEIGQTGVKDSTVQSLLVGEIDNNAYYAVQAFATKNGVRVYSDYDKGFCLKYYSTDNSKHSILYFGDSITYGSPYKSASSRHIFSMPYRIAQLTGCSYYNPSIPGSTYHDLGVNPDGTNVENTNYYRYRICREVVDRIANGELPGNWESLDTAKNSNGTTNTKISDYNIVVLSAGTNDYLDNTVIGGQDSTEITTFNGALNHIMDKIVEASRERISNGLEGIKVVFVDLFYSDRTYNEKQIHNRDTTLNKIGYYLTDYQDALNKQLEKWTDAAAGTLEFYHFKTRDYNIVTSENCPYTASDNLHFTKFTYGQYGNAIAQFLVDNVF